MREAFPPEKYEYTHTVKCVEFEGLRLQSYCQESNTGNPEAMVFFLHGYGDYCKYYNYFFKPMANHGIMTYAVDRRGSGES